MKMVKVICFRGRWPIMCLGHMLICHPEWWDVKSRERKRKNVEFGIEERKKALRNTWIVGCRLYNLVSLRFGAFGRAGELVCAERTVIKKENVRSAALMSPLCCAHAHIYQKAFCMCVWVRFGKTPLNIFAAGSPLCACHSQKAQRGTQSKYSPSET